MSHFLLSLSSNCLTLSTCFRSDRADAHQALDAVVEEVNRDLKAWSAGDRDSDMWRRIVRNFTKLKDLRKQVSIPSFSRFFFVVTPLLLF